MNLLTQQTKELVRRKTEILVHGSEIEQEKEEDHHKNWTLRRMQTRGTCSLIAGSNPTNNIFRLNSGIFWNFGHSERN